MIKKFKTSYSPLKQSINIKFRCVASDYARPIQRRLRRVHLLAARSVNVPDRNLLWPFATTTRRAEVIHLIQLPLPMSTGKSHATRPLEQWSFVFIFESAMLINLHMANRVLVRYSRKQFSMNRLTYQLNWRSSSFSSLKFIELVGSLKLCSRTWLSILSHFMFPTC